MWSFVVRQVQVKQPKYHNFYMKLAGLILIVVCTHLYSVKKKIINIFFLDNPGLIGVTQPRRVATVSMAKRVADELNLSDKEVSYQVYNIKKKHVRNIIHPYCFRFVMMLLYPIKRVLNS